jgi:membrane-bound lytic murein transglycosylase A
LTNDVRNLTRAALEESVFSAEQAPILAWTDDPIGLFFLQIQGSGCLVLPDSTRLHLRYAGNNGHPYQSIGSALIESGVLPREGLSLDLLKGYLHSDLSRAQKVMQLNPRYIFFTLDREPIIGTHGSELVPFRSVAADPEIYPAHSLLLIKAPIALSENSRAETLEDDAMFLALCHDTGTAIKGPDRLDLFCGDDHRAEVMAGSLRAPATIWRFDRK